MGKKRNNKGRKSPISKVQIKKAGNEDLAVSRYRISELGSGALSLIRDEALDAAPFELQWPQVINTIESMKQDATVATALDVTYLFIEKAFDTFKVIPNKKSPASVEAAEFIDYCFRNMDNQTLRQYARSSASFNEYGFSVAEKVYTQVKTGKYAGRFKLKRLANRPQASLDQAVPFVYSDDNRELRGVQQDLNSFKGDDLSINFIRVISGNRGTRSAGVSVFIPKEKLVILNYNSSDTDAMGTSPLIACYKAFREKILIENLETIGVTKDLGGILELKIPASILQKASLNPNSYEADLVRDLTTNAANAHAGEQSFFILPSDVNQTGGAQYSMHLKGIDGTGKQYNTSDLVKERKKSILDRFGAGFMNLGNDKGGSYNLSESKQTIHYAFVERNVSIIQEGLNKNVIPQLLALNGIRLTDEDMPRIQHGQIVEVDKEEFSKFVQRTASVGMLPKTPEVINHILEVGGFDYRIDEDLTIEELSMILPLMTSRSGDGLAEGKSGNGTANIDESAIRDNTVANNEN